MKDLNIHRRTNTTYQIKQVEHEGKPHIVVPVIMMVEGVHSGSQGPVLHTSAELGKYPATWDGIPVVVGHPKNAEGVYVSANSPEVIESEKIGRIYNTTFEDNKLKAEAWIEVDKLTQVSPLALSYIQQGRPLDVSVGVFTDAEEVTGVHNGETYQAIARNHRPDHLALLPGEQGACSWADGCGIRVNKSNKNQTTNETLMTNEELAQMKQARVDAVVTNSAINANVQGFRERVERLRTMVDAMDNEQKYHYLEEVYEDYLIYAKRMRGGQPVQDAYYKQNYTITEQGVIEFMDAPIPVVKTVTYTPLNNNQMKRTKYPDKKMEVNGKSSCFLGKVEKLIQSNQTHFTEQDKEWLLTQEEATLDKLMPKPVIEANAEQMVQAFRNTIKTEEDLIKAAPESMQPVLKAGFAANAEKRNTLIEKIMANSEKDTWTKEELGAMEMNLLEKVANTIKAPADYSLNGGKPVTQTNGEAQDADNLLLPPGVK